MLCTDAGHERRRSMSALTTGDKVRPRSASMGRIEFSPNLTGWSSQRSPATPCFVSPRMAFSTQFSYDSPIQVLTSRSPCVFKPMAIPSLYSSSWSLKKLPLRCKILLTILLLSLAACLFVVRNTMGTEASCTSPGQCENTAHDHKDFKRFVRSASEPVKYHTLTSDLNNLDVGIPSKGIASPDLATTGSITPLEQLPFVNEKPKVIIGSNVDQSKDFSQTEAGFSQTEAGFSQTEAGFSHTESGFPKSDSASLDDLPASTQDQLPVAAESGFLSSHLDLQGMQDKDLESLDQFMDKPLPKPEAFDQDIAARMTKHSGLLRSDKSVQRNYEQSNGFGMDRQSPDAWQGRYPNAPLRMDRLPPGINPKRYLREL